MHQGISAQRPDKQPHVPHASQGECSSWFSSSSAGNYSPSPTAGCGRANLQGPVPKSWSPAVNAREPTEGRASYFSSPAANYLKRKVLLKSRREPLETNQRLHSLTDSTWKSCLEFPYMAQIQAIWETRGLHRCSSRFGSLPTSVGSDEKTLLTK